MRYRVLTPSTPPESGYAGHGPYRDTEDDALTAAEAWARKNPEQAAYVEEHDDDGAVASNRVWSVAYRVGPATLPPPGGTSVVYGPGVLEAVADFRERTNTVEPHPDLPGRDLITEVAGLPGDFAAFVKYDEGHPATDPERTDNPVEAGTVQEAPPL